MDALEGIDEEGIQETDNLAREARIRSAYLEWCKSNGKDPDESRFPTFSSNFLTMEKFAAANGKEMVLNKYADCTQDEYQALVNAPAPAPAPAAKVLMETAVSGDMAGDDDVMTALQAVAEAEAAANAAISAASSEKDAVSVKEISTHVSLSNCSHFSFQLKKAAEAKAAEAAQARLELAEKKKAETAARAALASLSQEELKERSEKERKERQIAQEKATETLRKANEAAAIAVVRILNVDSS